MSPRMKRVLWLMRVAYRGYPINWDVPSDRSPLAALHRRGLLKKGKEFVRQRHYPFRAYWKTVWTPKPEIETLEQAKAKARRLWGMKAFAEERIDSWTRLRYGRYVVGSGTWACNDGKGKVWVVGNSHHSWDDAFADAMGRYKYWELPQ